MSILNLLLIPIIIVSLVSKKRQFPYVISLLASLAAATFIYAQQSLANILFTVALFNITPLACLRFNQNSRKFRLSLEESKDRESRIYQQLLKERSIIRQSNSQLGTEVSRIAGLYKVTKDMSEVVNFSEAFDILGKKMMELFRYKRSHLVLMDEDVLTLRIKKVFELRYARFPSRQVDADADAMEILRQSLRAQKVTFIKEKSLTLAPLIVQNKFLGALAVEDLPFEALENFSILANQFSLEFKRIRLYQKIEELAITDGLTGLFVRRYFLARLDEELKRSARHNLPLAFLMLDIDHFKECNDNFGHLTGDVVLKEVAARIKACVREIDLVGRYGGEEFSLLLPDTDKEGAGFVAERICSSIARQKIEAYDEHTKVTVSIGVAAFPEDAAVTQHLIDKSDQALYRAKQKGRNRVEIF